MRNRTLICIAYILSIINFCMGQSVISNYYDYAKMRNPQPIPFYRDYLRLDCLPLGTIFDPFIRQPNLTFPGDYFYPPDAYRPREFAGKDLIVTLSRSEINLVHAFLQDNLYHRFSDSLVLSSLNGYGFDYPNGPHREPYTMLREGDTVYVISGWLGKFISFYRVVPGDFRMTVPQLMKQLQEITPLAKEIKAGAFKQESDSLNYFLEYVDKEQMIRIRNYLMDTILPPGSPNGPGKLYNLIEITKFYDKEVIP